MTVLTDRFARVEDYARIAYAAQVRKGTDLPYLTHLLAIVTLVIKSRRRQRFVYRDSTNEPDPFWWYAKAMRSSTLDEGAAC